MSEDAKFYGDNGQVSKARNDIVARLRTMADWIESLPVDDHLRGLMPWITRDTEAVERIKLLRNVPRSARNSEQFDRPKR